MPTASPARVLVAEDNRADRLLLSAIVRNEGYHVVEAVDGCDAVDQFRRHRPHIVLLDALMPRMDGFEVARRIKAESGEQFVPVIFLSAMSTSEALLAAVEAGADDFLGKPYNRVMLRAKLNALERLRTLHATMQRQRDEISRHHAHLLQEQEAAKAIFDNVAHTGNLDEPFIRYLISPLAMFNGDVLLAARNPAGDLYLLLGDFTGHGLTAAVGAMPLAEIFYGMSGKGFGPGDILREANRKLGTILPKGYFCCATLLALNFHKGTIEYWNGGLPPGCLFRPAGREIQPLESLHLPLGILADARFDGTTRVLEVEPGDRLILCTDGVVEARNDVDEAFGFERRDAIIRGIEARESAVDALKQAVYTHIGASGRDDDITLVEVTVVPPQQLPLARGNETSEGPDGSAGAQEWRLSYELGPRSLRSSNPLPLLQHVVTEFPQLRRHAGAIFTVLTELYSNALEHGLLRLDSNLKSSADGFAEYYQARSRALESLEGFLRFDFRCEMDGSAGRLYITVTDSGPGFDYRAKLGELDEAAGRAYHGRGMRLLHELCQSVSYRGPGNEVEVVFGWGSSHG